MASIFSAPVYSIGGDVNMLETATATTLFANVANVYGNVLVSNGLKLSGGMFANASALVANTGTFANGLTVTGAVSALTSTLTASTLVIGASTSFANNVIIGTGATPYTTMAMQGNVCQIVGNTYYANVGALSSAAISIANNGSNGATVNVATMTSGGSSNPLLTRVSITDTAATFSVATSHANGSLAAPSITFTGETGTGMYKPAPGNVGLVSQGVAAMYANALGITVPGTVTAGNVAVGNVGYTLGNTALTTTQYTSNAGLLYTTGNVNTPANIIATGNVTLTYYGRTSQVGYIEYTIPALQPGTPFSIQMDYQYYGTADGFCMQFWYTNGSYTFGSGAGRPDVRNIAAGYRLGYDIFGGGGFVPGAYFMRNASATVAGTSEILAKAASTLPANVWCTYLLKFDGLATWTAQIANASNTQQLFMSNVVVDPQALSIWQAATYPNTLRIIGAAGGQTSTQVIRNVNFTVLPGNVVMSQTGSGALQTATTSTSNALVVGQNGYVGIGTQYPTAALHIAGNMAMWGNSLSYGSIVNVPSLPANAILANANVVTTNSIFANTLNVVGNTALANSYFLGTLKPNTATSIVQWQGVGPMPMIEVYNSSTDRYGLGVVLGGTTRLYTTAATSTTASVCLGKYSTAANPVSTDWIVCNSSGIYKQAQVTMTANTIVFSGKANTQPIADRTGTFSNYANASTLNFAAISGMVLVNNANTGAVSLFLVGNGVVSVANSNTNPQTGTFTANVTIGGYTWTNTSGNTANVSFTSVKTRATG